MWGVGGGGEVKGGKAGAEDYRDPTGISLWSELLMMYASAAF